MLYLSIATVTCSNWLVSKLQHTWNEACIHYPDNTMEVFSLLVKMSRIIESDSGYTELKVIKPFDTRWLAHEWCEGSAER